MSILIMSLTIVAAGCGSKAKQSAAGGEGKGSSQKAAAPRGSEGSGGGAKAPAKAVKAVAGGGHVRLIDRGCVEFEPQWSSIRVGQSLTWHSELKTRVTVHVPEGVFERTQYVVPPRGSAHTGPARQPGEHAIWSSPSACQAAPRGVQGTGPGVSIEPGGS